jgi:hypothetical protein
VNRPFYPAGKLPAIPGWLGRSVENKACPGRFREEKKKNNNNNKYVAYSVNRPASNWVAVPTELSRFCPIWVPAFQRISGDVTDNYRKMCKSCANLGLSALLIHPLRSFITTDSIADSWTSHQTDLKSLPLGTLEDRVAGIHFSRSVNLSYQ